MEHQIFRFPKFLRWCCVKGAALRMTWPRFSRGGRITLKRWDGKITKRMGTRLSSQQSTFQFGRKSRRIASFLKSRRIASFSSLQIDR